MAGGREAAHGAVVAQLEDELVDGHRVAQFHEQVVAFVEADEKGFRIAGDVERLFPFGGDTEAVHLFPGGSEHGDVDGRVEERALRLGDG